MISSSAPPKAKPSSNDLNYLSKLFKSGKYTEVIENADILIFNFPDDAFLYNIRGVAAARLDRWPYALENYQKAIEHNPKYADAHNNMGNSLRNSGQLSEAILCYNRAIFIDPKHAEYHNNIGVSLLEAKQRSKAKVCFEKAIELNPDYLNAHINLGSVLNAVGQKEEAIHSFSKALEIDGNNVEAAHMLNVLRNENIPYIPKSYITSLFEAYANYFEKSLVEKLNYKGPEGLKRLLTELDDEAFETTLDLGCGTGLMGACLEERIKDIVGVDLFPKMLKTASELNIYGELLHSDVLDFLATSETKFDLFTAADVFIYLGDLTDVFQKMLNRSYVGAKVLFTTEHFDGESYRLNATGRFSHSSKYIEKLCSDIGARIVSFETSHLRNDAGKSVLGGFYLVHLP